jgi:hypothetical protein
MDPKLWCTLLEETSEANEYTYCYSSDEISSDLPRIYKERIEYVLFNLEVDLRNHLGGKRHDSFDFQYEMATYLSLWDNLQEYRLRIAPINLAILSLISINQTTEPKVQALCRKIINMSHWLNNPERTYDLLTRSLLGFFRFIVSAKKWERKCQGKTIRGGECGLHTLPLSLYCTTCLKNPKCGPIKMMPHQPPVGRGPMGQGIRFGF